MFDGTKIGPYTEFDAPEPAQRVRRLEVRRARCSSASLLDDYYIIRAGWMVGGGPGKDHKFVARILQQVREGRTVIHAVTDKLGTPTYTPDFADCFLGLIAVGGLRHLPHGLRRRRQSLRRGASASSRCSGATTSSWCEVTSDFFAEEFPSDRPYSEIMRNMALDLQGMNTMRPWPDALEDYIRTYFPDLVASELVLA